MNIIHLALDVIAPTPKPASLEDAFDFLKDILRGPSEATVFAPGQNQDLLDALGAILVEPSTSKASQSGAAVSTSKKKILNSLDKHDPSGSSLKQSKPATFRSSSSTSSFLLPIQPALF